MPGKGGKAKATGKAKAPTYYRRAHEVKYTTGERPPPPLVPHATDDKLELMSPKSLDCFAEKAKEAEKKARSKAAGKRAAGLPSYGFEPTGEGPRRSARFTTTIAMSESEVANDPRSSATRKSDRRAASEEGTTPVCEARGVLKVNLITPPPGAGAGPSNAW